MTFHNLTKIRPFFGSSVTQVQEQNEQLLENYTGYGNNFIKKSTVFNDTNGANIGLRNSSVTSAQYDRANYAETDFISEVRNNELPFKQIQTGKNIVYGDALVNEHREHMQIAPYRQSLPGMAPTGYSTIRKPASMNSEFLTKRETVKENDQIIGKKAQYIHVNTKENQKFRDSKHNSIENIFKLNKFRFNSNNKAENPAIKQVDKHIVSRKNYKDLTSMHNKVNEYGEFTNQHDGSVMNTETADGLHFPIKLDFKPILAESKSEVRMEDRAPQRFVSQETFSGRGMSYKAKEGGVVEARNEPRNRIFNVNNDSGKIVTQGKSTENMILGKHRENGKQFTDFTATVSGNKHVFDMTSTWLKELPIRKTGIDGINITTV